LDETFEVWTWAQLGIQAKPLGLLNVEGYFDGIREFIDHAVAEAFVKRTHADLLMIDTDIPALLDRLASAPPPPDEAKWLKP
ncbi:LOG family protein, partial [bacterium]|nr:LOG family protein [bacterium]